MNGKFLHFWLLLPYCISSATVGFSTPRLIVSITSQVMAGRPAPPVQDWPGIGIPWNGVARAARFIMARGIFLFPAPAGLNDDPRFPPLAGTSLSLAGPQNARFRAGERRLHRE
jgi:hypothetical protein